MQLVTTYRYSAVVAHPVHDYPVCGMCFQELGHYRFKRDVSAAFDKACADYKTKHKGRADIAELVFTLHCEPVMTLEARDEKHQWHYFNLTSSEITLNKEEDE